VGSAGASASSLRCLVEGVSLATRGQTDMRGLVTAGRAVRQELHRVSSVERGLVGCS
jgi:hypothetical protein